MNNKLLDYYNNTLTLKGVGELFKPIFINNYNTLQGDDKNNIFKHINHIYRRWYYSVAKDNTILSPCNIINTQIKNKFGNKFVVLPHYEYNELVNSSIKIHQKITIFSLDNHPIITDLKTFINECYPDIELCDDLGISNILYDKLINKLIFNDKSYMDFLVNISLQLKLLEELPSIHTKRAIPKKGWEEFFKKDSREIISLIVDAIISNAVDNLEEVVPFRPTMFTKDYIKNLLTEPQFMDDIFYDIFKDLNLDIFELTSKNIDLDKPSNKLEGFALATLYFLEIFLDMYIYCPLGYYLQLIEPAKLVHYEIKSELNQLLSLMNNTTDYHHVLYGGFNLFNLTGLGEELFANGSQTSKINEFNHNTDFIDVYYTLMLNATIKNNLDIDTLNLHNKSFV